MGELARLAGALRERGITLVLDFVLNHTSEDYEWARKAKVADHGFMDCYLTFSDRPLVDRFQEHLRDIFSDTVRRAGEDLRLEDYRTAWIEISPADQAD